MRELSREQLKDIAYGACFLGGGSLPICMKQIRALPADFSVKLVSVPAAAKDDSKMTAVLGYQGEDIEAVDEDPWQLEAALKALQRRYGGSIGYVIPVETEPLQFVAACIVAARLGLQVVDGDGAGRAVFDFAQTTFSYTPHGSASLPGATKKPAQKVLSALCKGRTRMFWATGAANLAEKLTARVGAGLGGLATWCMSGVTLIHAVKVRGTITLAERVGQLLRSASDPVGRVVQLLNRGRRQPRAFHLFTGTLKAIEPQLDEWYRFSFVGQRKNEVARVERGLVVWSSLSERPLALFPDCNCYSTLDGTPFGNFGDPSDLYGKQVAMVGVAAHPALMRRPILKRFRGSLMQLTGYAGPLVPLAELQRRAGGSLAGRSA